MWKLIVILVMVFVSCKRDKPFQSYRQIVVIDSCEYFLMQGYTGQFVTHKGNCKFCIQRQIEICKTQYMPLEFSNVLDFQYDTVNSDLTVYFLGGGKYIFNSVPYEKYSEMIESKKRTDYFNNNIKDKYKHKKIY